MVSRSEDDFSSQPQPSKSLPQSGSRTFEVIVPVFLKITVTADDDLHAEVLAQQAARSATTAQQVGDAIIHFHSLLTPVVR